MKIIKRTTFLAQSEAEGIRLAREKLGRDAVILATRSVKSGGIFGMFTRKMVEITAGVMEPETPHQDPLQQERAKLFQQILTQKAYGIKREDENEEAFLENTPEKKEQKSKPKKDSIEIHKEPQSVLISEVAEIKSVLNSVLERLGADSGFVHTLPPGLKELHRKMLANDLVQPHADEVLRDFISSNPNVSALTGEDLESRFMAWLSGLIPVSGPIIPKQGGGKVITFIGPTGVGKTTTIAKIAAIYTLYEKSRVVLLTADTYRVAAVEQFRTYARIIGAPLEVAFDPKELHQCIERHMDADYIFVDTAGRSQRDQMKVSELKAYIEAAHPDACILLLAANTKYRDMLEIIERFSVVPINSFIFTKLDETTSYGAILSLCRDFKKPIAYITTGQNVPNDIEVADSLRLASLAIGNDRVNCGG